MPQLLWLASMPPMGRAITAFDVNGARLHADSWAGTGVPVVLLHAGVADRRSWYGVAERLTAACTVVAYDRRGFGASPPSQTPFRHVDDLVGVLDEVGDEPAWLVGSSMGGQVALDTAIARPDRVAGLVLFAPAVSGAPDTDRLDADTQRLSDLLQAASSNLEEINRLEAWLWLDGPASPEGRVAGDARELALAMNAVILAHGVPEGEGDGDGDAWRDLEQVQLPVTVAWGDLDVPLLIEQCEQLVARLPHARRHVLPGTAHLPFLECPALVTEVITQAIAAG